MLHNIKFNMLNVVMLVLMKGALNETITLVTKI